MTKKSKDKITSVDTQSEIMQAADKPIRVPDCVTLDKDDMPFFDAVVAEFARAEWTDHSLQLAAMLARMMADLHEEQILLRKEGSVAYSEKGTPVINPRKTAVQMYAGSILSMRRSLQLHARAQGGEARDTGKRRGKAKGYEADADNDDPLIASPNNTH